MRAYLRTTGGIFALIVVAHVWRTVAERPELARHPGYLLLTAAAWLLGVWAALLLRREAAR